MAVPVDWLPVHRSDTVGHAPNSLGCLCHAGDHCRLPIGVAAVSQGITTIIGGQDGGQPFPLAPAMDSLTATPAALNVAYYAGHNTIRAAVLGADFKRVATLVEVDSMATLLRR